MIVFSVLTHLYVKNHIIVEDSGLKKSVKANLISFVGLSIFSFIFNVVTPAFSLVCTVFSGDIMIRFSALTVFFRVLLTIPTAATPIATMTTLTPVRSAVKELCEILFPSGEESGQGGGLEAGRATGLEVG